MFKLQLRKTTQTPDILLSVIFMLIVVLNVAAMLIFNQLIIIHVGSKELIISASLLTYIERQLTLPPSDNYDCRL